MIDAPVLRPLSLILALADDGTIGHEGKIPWHIPEDMARVKKLTMDHDVIMGRKTWESLPEGMRPLPGRRNIVVSRTYRYEAPGASVWRTLGGALDWAWWALPVNQKGPFILGAAELYREALPLATRIYLTEVHCSPGGDTRFDLDRTGFVETSRTMPRDTRVGAGDATGFSFVTLERESVVDQEAA